MALLTSEITRIKYELGWNVLNAGAEPYIGVAAVFDQVVAQYMKAGASTMSSTAVVAAAAPTPSALTLLSATGFNVGDRIVVDVDARQEFAMVETVAGSAVTVLLSLAHTGTYPVTVEGGESIVREILRQLQGIGAPGGRIDKAAAGAGIKRADDVEFFPAAGSSSKSRLEEMRGHREYLRDELCRALFGQGREDFFRACAGGAAGAYEVELY
jgi:hypothetical protein